jgi:1,4-dihydroxy-2-naphthoyl-CoA hydrolase
MNESTTRTESTELTQFLQTSMPLCGTLAMRLVENLPEKVAIELDWAESLCTINGVLHGGVLMALADSCGAMCAFANLPAGAIGTSTIESKTNFLGAVRSGTATAVSTPLHVGGSTIVIETDIRDDTGKRVVKTIQTQTVLRAKN